MDTFIESSQNNFEPKDSLTQSNMLNSLNLFDNQKITQTIYDPNFINNQESKISENIINIPASEVYQRKDEEVPYTFVGEFNFDSNIGATSQIKNTNLDLFAMNNNQNILDSATTNTHLIPRNQFEEPKIENLNTNLNIDPLNDNINTNIPGTEEKYIFDGGIFDVNNINPSPEMNYSDNANIFNNNNYIFDVNNNNFPTNEANQDNNINNFININEIFNTDYAQTVYHDTNNPNPTKNSNSNLLNVLTFGESDQNKQKFENPQVEFTEKQDVYHENDNYQPKIENEQLNLNTNNIKEKEQKEKENNLNFKHIKSPFETLKENKTLLIENKSAIENNDTNVAFPEAKKTDEKKEEEFKTIILPNESTENKKENDIQLINNVPNTIQEPQKIEEPPKIEEKKEEKEENKLIDISDEIKEIKEMPKKPFEQREVIFNKKNIKVIKIEDDETTFCTGLLTPLFKKLFG